MNVFSALVNELKGVFGKGYLLAGLLPAAVVTLGWRWFAGGGRLAEVFREVTPLLSESGGPEELAELAAVTLLVGLVFFAGRTALVDFFQRLPGWPLAPLRELLLRRQVIRRERLLHHAELLTHDLTILRWLEEGKWKPPVDLPPHRLGAAVPGKGWFRVLRRSEEKTRSRVLLLSRVAFRAALGDPAEAPRPPSRVQARRIVAGLETLYDLAHREPDGEVYKAEVATWSELLKAERAARILEMLSARLQRRWVLPRRGLEGLPALKRMLPTRLGTRAAALDGYAEKRYGIATSTLLVRLWSVLDESERKRLADNQLSIEVLVNLSASLALLSAAALTQNLYDAWPWRLALAFDLRAALFIALPLVFAAVLYRAAVQTYGALSEKVIRNLDLERLKLLEELGFERPEHVGEELELWAELRRFFVDGRPLDPDRPLSSDG